VKFPTKTQINGFLLFLLWVGIIGGYLYALSNMGQWFGSMFTAGQIAVGLTVIIFGSLLLFVRLTIPKE
jgi:hypothetical protein